MENIKNWCSNKENLKILFMIGMAIVLVFVLKNRFSEKTANTSGSSSTHYDTGMGSLTQNSARRDNSRMAEKAPARLKQVMLHGLKAPISLKRDIFSYRISKNSSKREEAQKDSGLKLNATITDGSEPLAIIGNEVLGIGESVNGFEIRAIKNNEAVLLRDGKHYTLRIIEE